MGCCLCFTPMGILWKGKCLGWVNFLENSLRYECQCILYRSVICDQKTLEGSISALPGFYSFIHFTIGTWAIVNPLWRCDIMNSPDPLSCAPLYPRDSPPPTPHSTSPLMGHVCTCNHAPKIWPLLQILREDITTPLNWTGPWGLTTSLADRTREPEAFLGVGRVNMKEGEGGGRNWEG